MAVERCSLLWISDPQWRWRQGTVCLSSHELSIVLTAAGEDSFLQESASSMHTHAHTQTHTDQTNHSPLISFPVSPSSCFNNLWQNLMWFCGSTWFSVCSALIRLCLKHMEVQSNLGHTEAPDGDAWFKTRRRWKESQNNKKRIYGSKGLLDNSICCFFTIANAFVSLHVFVLGFYMIMRLICSCLVFICYTEGYHCAVPSAICAVTMLTDEYFSSLKSLFIKYLLAIIIIKNTKINNNSRHLVKNRHLLHPSTSRKLLYVRKCREVPLKPFHYLTPCTEIQKKIPCTTHT